MGIRLKRSFPFFSVRNMAIADNYLASTGSPVWSEMTIANAVKNGYKINSWVYRAVRMIAVSGSSVPWIVQTNDEPNENHPLSKLFEHPNPRISRQTMMELLISWMQLCGNAYLVPVKSRGNTTELWPCSPDRLRPVPSNDPTEWVKGYAKNQEKRY